MSDDQPQPTPGTPTSKQFRDARRQRFDRARPADERAADLRAAEDRSGEDWVTRRVGANGVICVAYQQLSVGKHRGGEVVDVHLDGGLLQVWHRNELLKTIVRTDTREVRKKRAAVAR